MPQIEEQKLLPLSASQKAVVFRQLLAPEAAHLNIGTRSVIYGDFDADLLASAVKAASETSDCLRAVLRDKSGVLCQEFPQNVAASFAMSEHADDAAAIAWGTRLIRRPYALFDSPLYRVALARVRGAESHLFVGCHHAMGDGMSLQLALERVCDCYNASLRRAPLPSFPQFADTISREQRYAASLAFERDARYWKKRLNPRPSAAFAGTGEGGELRNGAEDIRVSTQLDPHVYELITRLAAETGSSATTILIAALYAFASRWSGLEDLVLTTALLNRPGADDLRTVGPLASQALLRLSGGCDRPFPELVADVRDEARRAYRHHRFPLSALSDIAGGARELAGIMALTFSLVPYPDRPLTLGAARVSPRIIRVHSGYEPSAIQVSLQQPDPEGTPILDVMCNTGRVERDRARDLAREFGGFLERLVSGARRRIDEVPIYTPGEKQSAVADSHRAIARPSGWAPFHEQFASHAALRPDAIALELEGESLTYRELDRRANQLARYLRSSGAGPETLVGLHMDRGPEMIVGLLGILKAGSAYLPLDTGLPAGRLSFLISNAKPFLLVTQQERVPTIHRYGVPTIVLDASWTASSREDAQAPDCEVAPHHLAYVIYTSGSTGQPKGVALHHGGLANLIAAQAELLRLGPTDRVLQFAPLSFDASIWEIAMALSAGATLCLTRDPRHLARELAGSRVTVVTLPPSALPLIDEASLPDLRIMVLAGEACTQKQVARWAPHCSVVNGYGPTETTVCATSHRCREGEAPSIGRAIPDMKVYVLDDDLIPVAAGESGELFIGGAGVARGYLGCAGLTAQRFPASPFSSGERLYRSGDRVRQRQDGTLEFIGRIDQQVKIRGHRVEPGEVEAALMTHPWVEQAAVVPRTSTGGELRLEAYFTSRQGMRCTVSLVREHLSARLPDYMMPGALVPLDEMPLTPNGKIDRRALRPVRGPSPSAHRTGARPGSTTERTLAGIWAEVLKVEGVDLDQNFFDLGGSSVSLASVCERFRARTGAEVELVDFFAYPTIRRMARHLETTRAHARTC